ncbi:hypothetical protein CHELA20_11379 [Hyphomicrobiales bacterium]|nr:hypothetical protein CHELA20_11379 [Hyphomicrobiales bacterium]CAH1695745.1 hypothetical protein CHELA41_51626 [Hyphomicrobiales bacterium]
MIAEILANLLGIFVLEAIFDIAGHNLTDRGGRVFALRYGPNSNVTIRQHSYKPIVVTNRHDARVNLRHDTGGLLNGVIGTGDTNVACHHFAHSHGRHSSGFWTAPHP